MADRRAFELRLAGAALVRHRGTVGLALVAITIAAALCSALLHVTRELGPRVTDELRALGPNLVIVSARGEHAFLDLATARTRLAALGLDAVPVLYASLLVEGEPTPVVGTDLAAMRRLHPEWRVGAGPPTGWIGARLAGRFSPGPHAWLLSSGDGRTRSPVVAGSPLETGGPEDRMWWLPLETVGPIAGRPGQASLFQARVADAAAADRIVAALARDPALRALPLRALTAAEGRLLDRLRVLMAFVTAAAVAAAVLCMIGTLTDLALARRRDVATLAALGAGRRDVVRLVAAESAAIGVAGGTIGFAAGAAIAWLVSRDVFHAGVGVRWEVLPLVVLGSAAAALLAAVGPVRVVLAREPAPALTGD